MGLKTSLFISTETFFLLFVVYSARGMRPTVYVNSNLNDLLAPSDFSCTGNYHNKYITDPRKCWTLYEAEQCDRRNGYKNRKKDAYDSLYTKYRCKEQAKVQLSRCYQVQKRMDCCNFDFETMSDCAKKTFLLREIGLVSVYDKMWESFFLKSFYCNNKTDEIGFGLVGLCSMYQRVFKKSLYKLSIVQRCWVRSKLVQCSSHLSQRKPNMDHDTNNKHFVCSDKPLITSTVGHETSFYDTLNYTLTERISFKNEICSAAYLSDQYDRVHLDMTRMADYANIYMAMKCDSKSTRELIKSSTLFNQTNFCTFGAALEYFSGLYYADKNLKQAVLTQTKNVLRHKARFHQCYNLQCFNGATKDLRNCKCHCLQPFFGDTCRTHPCEDEMTKLGKECPYLTEFKKCLANFQVGSPPYNDIHSEIKRKEDNCKKVGLHKECESQRKKSASMNAFQLNAVLQYCSSVYDAMQQKMLRLCVTYPDFCKQR